MSSDNKRLIRLNPVSDETTDALLKPAANSIGQAFGDILDGVFNFALTPIRKYNIVKDADLQDFIDKSNKHLYGIPEENRDASNLGFVLKTLEDARYQLNEESMREHFAKLIANTLDNRNKDKFSPMYSFILSNMTPSEANILSYFNNAPYQAIPTARIDLRQVNGAATSPSPHENLLLVDTDNFVNEQLAISHLLTSNLIEFFNSKELRQDYYLNRYQAYEKQVFTKVVEMNPLKLKSHEWKYRQINSYFSLTETGKSFCSFVM